jgi:hypothetical protein
LGRLQKSEISPEIQGISSWNFWNIYLCQPRHILRKAERISELASQRQVKEYSAGSR